MILLAGRERTGSEALPLPLLSPKIERRELGPKVWSSDSISWAVGGSGEEVSGDESTVSDSAGTASGSGSDTDYGSGSGSGCSVVDTTSDSSADTGWRSSVDDDAEA